MPDEHRSQIVAMPNSVLALCCNRGTEGIWHWMALMGVAPSLDQITSAWEFHLNEEKADRDG